MTDLLTLIGLGLNFIGALMIAKYTQHGTSPDWQNIKARKGGYFLFVFGFVVQMLAIMAKYCYFV
jgi:hypothetical protein